MQSPQFTSDGLCASGAGRNRLKRERKTQRTNQLKAHIEAMKAELRGIREKVKETATESQEARQILEMDVGKNRELMSTIEQLTGSLKDRTIEYDRERGEWARSSRAYEQIAIQAKDREITILMAEERANRLDFDQKLSNLQFTADAKCVEVEQLKDNVLHLETTLAGFFANLRPAWQQLDGVAAPEAVQTQIQLMEGLQEKLTEYQLELEETNRTLQVYEAKMKLMQFQNRRLRERFKECQKNLEMFANAFKTVEQLKDIIKVLENRICSENSQLEKKIQELQGAKLLSHGGGRESEESKGESAAKEPRDGVIGELGEVYAELMREQQSSLKVREAAAHGLDSLAEENENN